MGQVIVCNTLESKNVSSLRKWQHACRFQKRGMEIFVQILLLVCLFCKCFFRFFFFSRLICMSSVGISNIYIFVCLFTYNWKNLRVQLTKVCDHSSYKLVKKWILKLKIFKMTNLLQSITAGFVSLYL